jgi:outer membrane protein assembly factor BamA
MNDHSALLMKSGVFDGVTYKFDGQDLIYVLSVAPQLYAVQIANLPFIPGSDLDAKIHLRLPLYHGKAPTEGTRLHGVIDFLQQALADQGIQALVTATPSGAPNSRRATSMIFSIASPEVRVGAIQLHGVSSAMEVKIKRVVDHFSDTPFDTESIASNLEQEIASFYTDEG